MNIMQELTFSCRTDTEAEERTEVSYDVVIHSEKERLCGMPKKKITGRLTAFSQNRQKRFQDEDEIPKPSPKKLKEDPPEEQQGTKSEESDSKAGTSRTHSEMLKERRRQSKATARQSERYRQQERAREAETRRQARQDEEQREKERARDLEARRQARQDEEQRERERARDVEARRLARLEENRRSKEAMAKRLARQRELDLQNVSAPADDTIHNQPESELDHLIRLRSEHIAELSANNFRTNLFADNPLLEAGKVMFKALEETRWAHCRNCKETYICLEVGPRSQKCKRCAQNSKLFGEDNDLNPSPAPECLARLTPVEKSAISLICPVVAIYKKGISNASRGHTISLMQDVNALAMQLPRLPKDLPFIIIQSPNERLKDQTFRVRRNYLLEALAYLKVHNEDYRHIEISAPNADQYPENDILQDLPRIDPDELRIPEEEQTAANPDSVAEDASMLAVPQVCIGIYASTQV
jgi:hypothetical protein